MDTFSYFKSKLDQLMETSVRAQLFFQEPQYVDLDFDEISIRCGATRACLISEDWDYVVKFTYDEDAWGDPCERECDLYANAVDSEMEKYFAEPQYIGRYEWRGKGYWSRRIFRDYIINLEDSEEEILDELQDEDMEEISVSLYLYAYPKAEQASVWEHIPSNEVKEIIKHSGSPMAERNWNVAAYFIEEYGADSFLKLSDFLSWNQVNDLHGDNVGVVDGHLVLIDYAGYHDKESSEE